MQLPAHAGYRPGRAGDACAIAEHAILITTGFGVAAGLTLVGMAIGAGRPELVRRQVLQTALVAVAVVAIPAVVVTLRPSLWIGCFTAAPPNIAGCLFSCIINAGLLVLLARPRRNDVQSSSLRSGDAHSARGQRKRAKTGR